MEYSPLGKIARECLYSIEAHFPGVKLDNWIIMPNHIHILFQIVGYADISNVVGKYKAAVTRTTGKASMHSGKLWQSSFYDHIIRNEIDYQQIWQYISGNPSKWLEDRFYCE